MRCFYRSYGLIFSISIESGRTCKSRQWTGRLADDSCTHHRLFSVPFHCSSKEVPNHWRVQLSALFGHLWRFGYASFERYGIFLFTYYWEWSILPSSQKWSVEFLGLTVCECVMCSVLSTLAGMYCKLCAWVYHLKTCIKLLFKFWKDTIKFNVVCAVIRQSPGFRPTRCIVFRSIHLCLFYPHTEWRILMWNIQQNAPLNFLFLPFWN